MAIPVAEQISLELVMWGTPTTIVLIALLYGWLYGLGAFAQRYVRVSTSVGGTLQDIICKWDMLRIPKDQPLLLTAFMGTGVVLVFLFWGLLPVSTPHPHEEYEFVHVKKVEPKIIPNDVFKNAEQVLANAEATIKELEKEDPGAETPKEDKKASAKEESKPSKK